MNVRTPIMFFLFSTIAHAADPNIMPASTGNYIIGPCTITVPGTYKLAVDIIGTITIAADDVILDLNERILSTTQFGAHNIDITNQQNITIRNGNLRGIATYESVDDNAGGIFIESCTTINLSNLNIETSGVFNGTHGVLSVSGNNSASIKVTDCRISSTIDVIRMGIFMRDCNDTIVQNNVIENVSYGIYGQSANNVLISQCVLQNVDGGIINDLGQNLSIEHCAIQNCFEIGIQASGCTNVAIHNCEAQTINGIAASSGFSISTIQNIAISNCNALGNFEYGFIVGNINNASIENSVTQSCNTGTSVSSSNNITFKNCTFSNGQIGIQFFNVSQRVNVYDCTITNNTNYGISIIENTNGFVCNNFINNNGTGINNSDPSCSFFGNKATQNGTNYVGVPAATIVDFDLSTGLYSTVPFSSCNISVIP